MKAGGHAIVWRPGKGPKPVAWMLLPTGPDGELPELSFWSILALDKRKYELVDKGPAKGLATMRVPRALEYVVDEWCERDAKHMGTTRTIVLDCVKCAACCRENRVILYDDDFARWKQAGRDDLRGKAYTRNDKGDVVLRLKTEDKTCVHLNGKFCGIYPLRPDNCSMFPAGSEPCLTSREVEYEWGDTDAVDAPTTTTTVGAAPEPRSNTPTA